MKFFSKINRKKEDTESLLLLLRNSSQQNNFRKTNYEHFPDEFAKIIRDILDSEKEKIVKSLK